MSEPQSEPAVLYFSAPWCQPCKKYLPIVAKEAEAVGVELEVLNVDSEEGGALAALHMVQQVPTLTFIDADGNGTSYAGPRSRALVRELFGAWKETIS